MTAPRHRWIWRATATFAPVAGALLLLAWLTLQHWPLRHRALLARERMVHDAGHAWHVARLPLPPGLGPAGDDHGHTETSDLTLHEDGIPLGPAHAAHAVVRDVGAGAYSHWRGSLWFSTRDGSDPRGNGRTYTIHAPLRLPAAAWWLGAALLAVGAFARLHRRLQARPDPGQVFCRATGRVLIAVAAAAAITVAVLHAAPPRFVQSVAVTGPGPVDLFGMQRSWRIPPFCVGVWPEQVAAAADGPVQFELPVVPSRGALVCTALLAITGLWLLRQPRRLRLQPRSIAAAAAWLPLLAAVPAAAAATLANVVGVLAPPLRAPLDGLPTQPSFGPLDRTLSWPALAAQLEPRAGESAADLVHRLNRAVADGVAHIWDRRFGRELRLQVPATENWLLWLAGELDARQREYFFVDARRMLERGVGMCGHVAHALGELLVAAGLDARVAQLGGHTVVVVDVDGAWWVADPDFGVVLPHSLAQLADDPGAAATAYAAALARYGRAEAAVEATQLAALYDPAGNSIGPGRPIADLPAHAVRREGLAYALKWSLPAVVLALWLAAVALGRRAGVGAAGARR